MSEAMPPRVRIALTGLDLRYDAGRGPHGFALKVPRLTGVGGMMLGIAGRSGSGKSSLLNVLGLLQEPSGPDFRLELCYPRDGRTIVRQFPPPPGESSAPAELVRNEAFGYIFQFHYLLPSLGVADNLTLPLRLRPDHDRALAATWAASFFEQVGLTAEGVDPWRRPGKLSGGQNQRVAIGRALVHGPAFLLADEPTASVDAARRSQVLARLRSYADSGNFVLLVTHELSDLARYCDRILVLRNGTLSFPFAGDPDDLAEPDFGDDRRRLPPVDASYRTRSSEDSDRVLQILNAIELDPGAAPRRERTVQGILPFEPLPAPAAAPPPAPAPRPLGRPPRDDRGRRPRLGTRVWPFAWAEFRSGRQAVIRAVVALVLMAITSLFVLLFDLANGCVGYTRRVTLGRDEFLHRLTVRPRQGETFTSEQVAAIRGLERPLGLRRAPTFLQEFGLLHFDNAVGKDEVSSAYSVSPGDPSIAPIGPGQESAAQVGLLIRHGDARWCTAGDPVQDFGAVLMSWETFRDKYLGFNDDLSRERYLAEFLHIKPGDPVPEGMIPEGMPWEVFRKSLRLDDLSWDRYRDEVLRLKPGQPIPEGAIPREIVLSITKATDREYEGGFDGKATAPLGGFDGKVTVPLALFDYPPRIIAEAKHGLQLAGIYLPEGFLTRIKLPEGKRSGNWQPENAFSYPRADGGMVAKAYDLIDRIVVKVSGARSPGWAAAPAVREAAGLPFGGRPPTFEDRADGSLVMQLDPQGNPNHRFTRGGYLHSPAGWPVLARAVKDAAGVSAVAPPEVIPIPVDAVAITPPPLNPPYFLSAGLAFEDAGALVKGAEILEAIHHDLEVRGPVGAAKKMSSLGSWVMLANTSLLPAFVFVMLTVLGLTAFLIVSSKMAEGAILRAYGLTPGGIARLYQVELVYLTLPAGLLGSLLALALPYFTNDWFAGVFVKLGLIDEIAGGEAAATSVAIFLSRQVPSWFTALGILGLILGISLIVLLGSLVAIGQLRRSQIASALRGETQ